MDTAVLAPVNPSSFAEKAGPSASGESLEKLGWEHAEVTTAGPRLWSSWSQQPGGFCSLGPFGTRDRQTRVRRLS